MLSTFVSQQRGPPPRSEELVDFVEHSFTACVLLLMAIVVFRLGSKVFLKVLYTIFMLYGSSMQ